MSEGFPLLTTRAVPYRGVLGELAAFIEGTSSLSRFKELGCNYWDGNAEAWAPGQDTVGRIYGVQWRDWRNGDRSIDQLKRLVEGLISRPYDRRHILTAWNPGELEEMCLPPCHIFAQFYRSSVSSRLDCTVYMRSVDLCLGLPADLVLYAMLLTLIAEETKLHPGMLIFMLGDAHIYENHLDSWKIQRSREPHSDLPKAHFPAGMGLWNFDPTQVSFVGYHPEPNIKYELNV
jgi:thymidylate synthase